MKRKNELLDCVKKNLIGGISIQDFRGFTYFILQANFQPSKTQRLEKKIRINIFGIKIRRLIKSKKVFKA